MSSKQPVPAIVTFISSSRSRPPHPSQFDEYLDELTEPELLVFVEQLVRGNVLLQDILAGWR